MVKIENDKLLKTSAGIVGFYGLAFALPDEKCFHQFVFTDKTKFAPETNAINAVTHLATSALLWSASSKDEKVQKDALKIAGVSFLTAAGTNAYFTANGKIKKEMGWAAAASAAVVGGLATYQGFKKDKKKEAAKPAAAAVAPAKKK